MDRLRGYLDPELDVEGFNGWVRLYNSLITRERQHVAAHNQWTAAYNEKCANHCYSQGDYAAAVLELRRPDLNFGENDERVRYCDWGRR